jgi:DNA repair photolyase
VLAEQLQRLRKRSRISFSTVCDPYQPLELKYQITRQCLEILTHYRHSVSILTKSTIIVRDVDILSKLYKLKVSFTVTTMDEQVRRVFEPGAPSTEKRFKALRTLAHSGIRTSIFVAPVLPHLSDSERNLGNILKAAKLAGAEYVIFDTLNPYPKVWRNVRKLVKTHFSKAIESYDYYYANRKRYKARLRDRIARLGDRYNIEYKFVF